MKAATDDERSLFEHALVGAATAALREPVNLPVLDALVGGRVAGIDVLRRVLLAGLAEPVTLVDVKVPVENELQLAATLETFSDDTLDDAYQQLLATSVELVSGEFVLRPGEGTLRRRLGAWYTPTALVEAIGEAVVQPLVDRAGVQGADALGALRFLDPSCGSGRFLTDAAERVRVALQRCSPDDPQDSIRASAAATVAGVDIDPVAVALARRRLRREFGSAPHFEVGDFLLGTRPRGFTSADVVIGNPPFLGQLGKDTSLDRKTASRYREVLGPVVRGYVDVAALFLFASVGCVQSGGVVALVQPRSVLSTQHAKRVRDSVMSRACALGVLDTTTSLFDAAVNPVVVVAITDPDTIDTINTPTTAVRIRRDMRPGARWAALLGARDVGPEVRLVDHTTMGVVSTVMADFRDQYYGLRGAICEGAGVDIHVPSQASQQLPMLTTCGLIDVAVLQWGVRPTRFDSQVFERPIVMREQLAGTAIGDWLTSRLVPKVLVATQSRVVEGVADPRGVCVPSVPVLTVLPGTADIWSILAVVHSPVASAWIAQRVAGSALSASALRVSVVELRQMPFPRESEALRNAAECMRLATAAGERLDLDDYVHQVEQSGAFVHQAFGLAEQDDAEVTAWWRARWIPRLG